ncbi:GIY-YIG nuclease family protein [Streptomyces prunicolor]|uniref:GIY-YIG nuclease family protein n=1 Tax=Streptomyces prunicolor TaxID=67348 RepID=UPI0035709838
MTGLSRGWRVNRTTEQPSWTPSARARTTAATGSPGSRSASRSRAAKRPWLQSPHPDLDAGRLLYVGIAPRHMANRTSTQNLRKRVRYHYRGNAAGSTLRLTLGSLLGLELRRVGSGKRMTFGKAGEATPS